MKLSTSNAARTCVLAAATLGLALAAVSFTPNVARAEQWCISEGGTNICHPTLAECEKAHPGRACVKGAS